MSVRIERAECFVYRAKIEKPIVNAFGTIPERVAVFVRLTDNDGATGWGEIWSNFPTIAAEHRARLFDAFIAPRLVGKTMERPETFWADTDRALHLWGLQAGEPGAFAAALSGADGALHDLFARRASVPLWRWLGGTEGGPLPLYASGLNPEPEALGQVAKARSEGHRNFKIKIGFGEARDLATLRPVFASLRSGERVMVDINQGWDLRSAMHMVRTLGEFPLTWIEEPLSADRPNWEWAQVSGASRAPLAAGENLRGYVDFHKALAEAHLGFVQPDCCKWGGITANLAIGRAVVGSGRAYCPHFLAGGIGQLASLHLLAAVRGPGLLEMDANPNPLRSLVVDPVLKLSEGTVNVPTSPGLGTEPDLAALQPYLVARHERCSGP
ncbi:MAG: mandelate racemase/muconate lactonizing enzyme family protein [Proteobacteria bacterium]|nr:mandelate racemase/muconate lactonizing enzyme family protein [Pseudomonadota bacterium]